MAELLVINGETQRTFNNVSFALEADNKTIKLNTLNAQTPWGEAVIALQMDTLKPFALTGEATIKQLTANMPYDIKTKLSGDLNTLRVQSALQLTTTNGKLAITQENANIATPSAKMAIDGQIALNGDFAMRLQAHLTDVHPERLANYASTTSNVLPSAGLNTSAELNINTNIEGKLSPEPQLTVQYTTHDSQLQNQPFVNHP
mgnify:CR=1 FL=1